MSKKPSYYPLGADRVWADKFPVANVLRKTAQLFMCHGYEEIGKENVPDVPCYICPTHSKLYAPLVLNKLYKREHRIWSNGFLLGSKIFPKHIVNNVLPNRTGFKYYALNFLAHFLAFPATRMMLSFNPIPVYLDARMIITIKKSVLTIQEGKDVIMFPEWKTKVEGYKFVNQVKGGIAMAAKETFKATNKPVPIVPVYVCPALKKVIYCTPIWVENIENFSEQTETIKKHIMDSIEAAGNSLPPHKIVPYSEDSYTAEEKAAMKKAKQEMENNKTENK